MARKHVWMAALAAGVAALVIGVSAVPSSAQAQERALVVRFATLAPGAFHPTHSNWLFDNNGNYLETTSGSGNFSAGLFFEDSRVRLTNLVLYAYDNGSSSVCLTMYRTTPADGNPSTEDQMGQVCSTGTGTSVRTFEISSWNYPFVYGAHGAYLWVSLPSPDYKFYGAKITYTFEP